MPFHWEEFLQVATHLAAGHPAFSDEAAKRCAISRAYYAAFCHARNWAEANTVFKRRGEADDHGELVRLFRTQGRTDLASRLTFLRERRNQCDYDDAVPPALNATALIREAQKVIDELRPRGHARASRGTSQETGASGGDTSPGS